MSENNPLPIFISYSHKDARHLQSLLTFLKPMQRDQQVDAWSDQRIHIGQKGDEEIGKALNAAKIAILLVSQDFLASDYIAKNELPPLLKAAKERGVKIFPIIIGHCQFSQHKELSQYQAANPPEKPLSGLSKTAKEKVWLDVANAVEAALKTANP